MSETAGAWLRRMARRRDVGFLLVVAALFAVYYGYGYATSASRITDRLAARLAENPERVDIRITTNFPPQAFHMGVYQRVGIVRGTRGSTAELARVEPSAVSRLSRKYWIARIDLPPPRR